MQAWTIQMLLVVVGIFAIHRGDQPERLVAAILVASFVLDIPNHILFGQPTFYVVNPGHFVIDLWTFIGLMWIALSANRAWPLWVCAAQNIVMLGHIGKLVDLDNFRRGYWVMTQLPVLLQLAVLFLGTWAHVRRQRRLGGYHAWRLRLQSSTSARIA
ncbi:hypothetical protein [Novosphingobium lentum]|uniref:hypothetical protein n=1 Tax=Novosphingobium lentum TaxID=145287 RepID=UPI00082C4182|nr:hypothetical protein [Novosphingobium lentum]